MKATCYHVRNQKGEKIIGGSITADSLDSAADTICRGYGLTMRVTNSGRVMFHKGDSPVWVYLSVDPAESTQGKTALAEHRAKRAAADKIERDALREVTDELDNIDPRELLRVWKASKA